MQITKRRPNSFKFLIPTLLTAFLSVTAGAESHLQSTRFAPCNPHPQDPWSTGNAYPAGKFKGQCLETKLKRPVTVIKDDTQEITFVNFRHQGQFWTATMPVESIKTVYFQIVDLNAHKLEKLGALITHNHLRIKLKEGLKLKLTPQPGNPLAATEVDDFVISYNFVGIVGSTYNPIAGFKSSYYQSVLQMYSTADEAESRFKKSKLTVYQVPLNLDQKQAYQLFRTAAFTSQKWQYSVPYNTKSMNCTNVVFDLLDTIAKPAEVPSFVYKWRQSLDLGYKHSLKALKARGWITSETKVQSMNAEFGLPDYQ